MAGLAKSDSRHLPCHLRHVHTNSERFDDEREPNKICDTQIQPRYQHGAGSCALPSYDYIEYYNGTVEIKLEVADWKEIYDYADIDMTDLKMIEAWLRDDPGKVDHGESGLKVKSWYVEFVPKGDRIVLSVDEFDAELPEPKTTMRVTYESHFHYRDWRSSHQQSAQRDRSVPSYPKDTVLCSAAV